MRRYKLLLSILFLPGFVFADVFYLEKANKYFLWKIFDIKTQTAKIFHKTKFEPKDILWDIKTKQAYYFYRKAIYKYNWNTKKTEKLYSFKKLDNPEILSLDKNGKIKFVLTTEVPDSALKSVMKGDERQTYFQFFGKDYLFDGYFVGIGYMAQVFELANKSAKIIAHVPITMAAEGATGLSPVEPFIENSKNVISIRQLKHLSTFGGTNRENKNGLTESVYYDLKPQQQQQIIKAFMPEKVADDMDEPAFYKLSQKSAFVAWTVFGDSRHFSPPVMLCREYCKNFYRFDYDRHNQLAISVTKTHFLIGREYTNEDSILFSRDTAKEIYDFGKTAMNVVFLPDNFKL